MTRRDQDQFLCGMALPSVIRQGLWLCCRMCFSRPMLKPQKTYTFPTVIAVGEECTGPVRWLSGKRACYPTGKLWMLGRHMLGGGPEGTDVLRPSLLTLSHACRHRLTDKCKVERGRPGVSTATVERSLTLPAVLRHLEGGEGLSGKGAWPLFPERKV